MNDMAPLDDKQLEGLRHSPQKLIRRLVLTAEIARNRVDDVERELRASQEQVAAAQYDAEDRILIVLDRDGSVEVWAKEWRPIAIAHRPDLGRGREEVADRYMLSRVALPYRDLYEKWGRCIVSGSTRGCMSATAYKLLQIELATLAAVNAMESETPVGEPAERV